MKVTLLAIGNVIGRHGSAVTYCISAAVLACCFGSTVWAQTVSPILSDQLLAKAAPDECFAGIGQPYPPLQAGGTCPSGSIPKRNQAYVWGLTQVGTQLWFGTAANVLCLGAGAVNPQPVQKQHMSANLAPASTPSSTTYPLLRAIGGHQRFTFTICLTTA